MMSQNSSYEVKLTQFEGPLDLLLHLVRKAEIDLREVQLAQITDQYMRYMEQVDELDLDRACGFLETASVLLLIKSRSLLPQAPRAEEQEEEDPEAVLLENLRLYEAYKKAAVFLRSKEQDGEQLFSRLPEEMEQEKPAPAVQGDAQALFRAFLAVVAKRQERLRTSKPPVMRIEADLWSVDGQKRKIRSLLSRNSAVRFTAFFDDDAPAAEIAVTFSAMLELWNAKEVRVRQDRAFGQIFVQTVDNMRISREAG